ncbi:hypothetical protein N7504_000515 [Penicillium tannophilum]|nr:hypothetical protein N7504_000515 [Penicillium tannophilum]
MTNNPQTDVLIIGGGPVGLLIGYSLARQGVKTTVVEQHDKVQKPMYGRACTLHPRTLEMLDQLDLLDDMNQIGYICRNSVTWKDGKRITSRGWHLMFDRMDGTFMDYCLNLRQRYSEDVIREAYSHAGGQLYMGWKLEDFSVHLSQSTDFKVTGKIRRSGANNELVTIDSKYIIGADGAHSNVRKLAGIQAQGDRTSFKLIRIDGDFKTNMPDNDVGFASIESKSHGNVLWAQLDHGVKRIGFAATPEMLARYGGSLTKEQAVAEAVKAMEPFTLKIEKVEWWTLYNVNQQLADTYLADERVLLAGDACHIHSSAGAQGMNTGVHDAVNLAWKLGGVIKGWYAPEALQTYEDERRTAAQYLIKLDKTVSAAVSGTVPEEYKGLSLDANELWTKITSDSMLFNIGLGVSYQENIFNKYPLTGMVSAGHRGPDSLLMAPGSRVPARLYQFTKSTGQWSIIVFAGQPAFTKEHLTLAVARLLELQSTLPKGMVRFLTLIAGSFGGGNNLFGTPRIGKFYFDPEYAAHGRYAVSTTQGAIVVLRPDGILGYATTLDDTASMGAFFAGFVDSS